MALFLFVILAPGSSPGQANRAGIQVHLSSSLFEGKNQMSFLCWPKERTKERACPGLGTPALNFHLKGTLNIYAGRR
jgi:hypothetical protein